MTAINPRQLVFIDSRVPDLQDLLDGLAPGEQAFVLDPSSDGVQQIADTLAANNFTGLSSIAIVSHGESGTLDLGSSAITDANLSGHSNALAEIGASLAPGGTINLYGCDVAQGAAGQQFINDFSTFAGGVQVDASTEPVGSPSFGGSSTLNAASQGGAAPTSVVTTPFTPAALANFSGALGAPSDPELWLGTDLSGGDIVHIDDVGGGATNGTTLYAGNSSLTGVEDIVVDPTHQVYFVLRQRSDGADQILEGSLVQALNNPTAAPTFTTIFTDTNFGTGTGNTTVHTDIIPQIALDTVSQQIYFVDDFDVTTGTNNIDKFERVNYNGSNLTTLGTVVAQATGAPTVEVTGFALDLVNHEAVFTVNQGGSISFTHTNAPSTFLYEATGVSSAASSVSMTQLPIGGASNFTFNPSMGFFDNAFPGGVAIDPTSHKLYFTMENGLTGGGLFEYNLTGNPNGNVTTIWAQTSAGPTGAPNALAIDPTTGEYFIAFDGGTTATHDQFNGVWRGLLASTAAPTSFLSFPANGDIVAAELWLDQQPTLSITALTPTWTEEGSDVSLISSATATDPDNGELVSATVSITGGFFTQSGTGDTLTDSTAGTSITSSYNSSTGVLTLSGVDSFTNYDNVLKSIQFHGGENPTGFSRTDNTRTLTWVVNDGLITSSPLTSSVSVLFVNDPPTLGSVPTSAHYTEEAGAVTLASGLSVTDADDLNLKSATVQITGGTFTGDADRLAADGINNGSFNNISVFYDSSTETLTLTGTDTLANYQFLLDRVTFVAGENPTNYGSNTTRTISWVAMDPSGTANSGQDTSSTSLTTLSITNVNDPPTLVLGTTVAAWMEESPATSLSPGATITDPDDLKLANATVKITGGFFTGDTLSATDVGNIVSSYNSTTGTLTLNGSDTLANYVTELNSLTYNGGENPTDFGSDPTRTLTWTLNDGSGTANSGSQIGTATSTINVTFINDPPSFDGVATTAQYTEEGSATTLTAGASVTDPDDLNLKSATVAIAFGSFAGAADTLAILGVTSGTLDGGKISYSYNSTTETLLLTGTDTLGQYQTALDEVAFLSGENPTNFGSNPTRQVTWTLQDPSGTANGGSDTSFQHTTTVSITNVNDPPTLVLGATTAQWTEEPGTPTTLAPNASVTDPDNLDLVSATVQITGGTFAGDSDTLAIGGATSGSVGAISFSYNSSTETLTLTGSDILANYKAVLDSVAFNAGENPDDFRSNPTRTVTWTLNDGSASNATSSTISTIDVTFINDAPTLAGVPQTVLGTPGSTVVLAPSTTITDPDDQKIASATVVITGGTFAGDGDTLAVSGATSGTVGAISFSYNSNTETLTLTGTDTLADYQNVLDTVAWHSTAPDPTNGGLNATRTLSWTVQDISGTLNGGVDTSTPDSETLTLDTPPTLVVGSTVAAWTEEQSPLATSLAPNVTISDPDGVNTELSATVRITGGTFSGDGDQLGFTLGSGMNLTASYSSSTETLTLTGSDSLANYQTVLDSVTFNAGENPTDFGSNPTRTLAWTVADHVGTESAPVSTTVSITNVNDPPTLTNLAPSASFTEHGSAVTLSGAVSVTDPDNLKLTGATVQITGGTFSGDGDQLGFNVGATNITASYNSSSETLTLSGSDTLANYRTVLDSITFSAGENPTDFGSNPSRTLTWQLNDGGGSNNLSTVVTSAVTITNVNDAPTIAGIAPSAAFTEEGGAVTLANPVSIVDVDDVNLSAATVQLGGGTGDTLAISGVTSGTLDSGKISYSYNSTTETLTLSGTDSLAAYQNALDAVTFNAGENPNNYGSNPTRTVTWTVMDPGGTANGGANVSTPVTTTVSITNVNDPPTLTNVAPSAAFTEHGSAVTLSGAVSVTDPDNLSLVGATVQITGGGFAGDTLAATAMNNIAFSYNSSTETLTLIGTDTLLHYQQVLDTVTFNAGENPTDFGSNPTRTVVWTLNDGSGSNNLSTAVTSTINVTNINDAPTLNGVPASASFTEEGGAVTLAGSASVVDVDDVNLSGATVKIVGGTFAGDGDVLAATGTASIAVSYNSTTETLTLSGTDTLAHYRSVLDAVTFNAGENPTNYGSNPTRTLAWTVMDPSGTANGGVNVSTPVTSTVNITNVNDPPTLANVATLVAFQPQHTITISPAISVSDPDSLTLTNATVAITAGSFSGDGDVLAIGGATSGAVGAISFSYNSSTETLTLTGSDTLAHYQSVLDSVTFSSGINPSNGNLNRTRTVSWVVNDGSGSNNLSTAATTTISIGGNVRNDFDGNNKSDLLLQNVPFSGNPNVMVELLNGTTVTSSGTITTPNGWTVEATGDFNHDNKADIILQNNDGLPEIWLMNGTSATSTVTLPNPGASWHVIATGDFNADGNTDILWQNNDGAAAIWEMNGTALIGGGTLSLNPGRSWHAIGAGDVNGDGKADILWQNNDGAAAIWEMNGTSIIGGGILSINPGASWHAINLGDFNGDGKADILWQNADGAAAIWELNGTSIIGGGILPANPGASWHAIGPSDFNGDGLADIVWQNNDGTPAIWEMNGTNIIGGGLLPNPGATWHVKDDGPISPDPAAAAASVAPALVLSSPDASNPVPMLSAPDGSANGSPPQSGSPSVAIGFINPGYGANAGSWLLPNPASLPLSGSPSAASGFTNPGYGTNAGPGFLPNPASPPQSAAPAAATGFTSPDYGQPTWPQLHPGTG